MYTLAQMRTQLNTAAQSSAPSATLTNWQDQAIGQMIDSCFWRIQRVTAADLVIDNATARWFLPGEDIAVLPPEQQTTPTAINTARVPNPTTATVVSASGSGSTLAAGVYRCARAYQTSYGETGLSPVGTVTLAAGQNIVFAAESFPAVEIPITAVAYYYTDPNDEVWKAGATTGTGLSSKTFTAPGSAPAAGKPYAIYAAFSSVAWITDSARTVTVEEQVKADGTLVNPATDTAGSAIAASSAPTVTGAATLVRVFYQCRIPQPDYTVGASVLYAPEQFARIASLGYYLRTLAENQAGGDTRNWAGRAESYLQQAQMLYNAASPRVLPQHMRADAWLEG